MNTSTRHVRPHVRDGVSQSSRMAELDGLRGVAIFLVVLWHYVGCLVNVPDMPLVNALAKATHWAWSGVDLFFVLSGFLIGGVLIDNRNSSNVMKVFYVRRACRILPLYLVMVALFWIVVSFDIFSNDWLFKGNIPIGSYLTFTQNFFMAAEQSFGPHWLGITWSLAVEEQFYLALPLIILFFAVSLASSRVGRIHRLGADLQESARAAGSLYAAFLPGRLIAFWSRGSDPLPVNDIAY